jgi:CRISPR-associated RAMP protein (TIGR02581 family)
MLKQLVNECVITLRLTPAGPVLVKSGTATVSGPDMAFVRTWRDGEWQVFLPGSSLKGVLRSHAERITRTLRMPSACDPFSKDGETMFCGERFEQRKKQFQEEPGTPEVYGQSCPICKLFGSTWYGSRLATADAYAVGPAPRPESRDGVGIDRFTGGASRGAKFDLEVITGGVFETSLHLRNFELWQLGLIGFLVQDLKDGLIRVGMGKSRGLGKVTGQVQGVRLDYLGLEVPQPENGRLALCGVGSLTPRVAAYGMMTPDEVSVDFSGVARSSGVRTTYTFSEDTFPWAEVAPRWVSYISSYTVPNLMAHTRFAGGM